MNAFFNETSIPFFGFVLYAQLYIIEHTAAKTASEVIGFIH